MSISNLKNFLLALLICLSGLQVAYAATELEDSRTIMEMNNATEALNKKDYKKAVQILNGLLKEKPNHFKAGWLLYKALTPLNAAEDIRITLENLYKLKPDDIDVLSELCKTYYHQKYLNKAVKTCKEAIRKDSSYPSNHINLAFTYWDYGKTNIALNIIKTTIKKFPKSSEALEAAGTLFHKNKNPKQSLEMYLKSVKLQTDVLGAEDAKPHLAVADIYFKEKKFDLALKHYEQSCLLDPHNAKAKLREATTKLRLLTNEDWSSKYIIALSGCFKKKSPDEQSF